MIKIKNVAVLGTGVMGSQIAAHCANAGLNVYAFDMTQEISESGIEKATKITLDIHEKEKGIAGGPYSKEIADTKTLKVVQFFRRAGFPLLAKAEKVE